MENIQFSEFLLLLRGGHDDDQDEVLELELHIQPVPAKKASVNILSSVQYFVNGEVYGDNTAT